MNKDEFMDEELTGMVKYTDETQPVDMPRMDRKPMPKEEHKCADDRDAEYTPLFTRKRTCMDRIAGCVKWVIPCGGIAMLLWWFEINGLMDMIAAYPCILACGIVGAFGTGMNVRK